jgi:hypothetical protein
MAPFAKILLPGLAALALAACGSQEEKAPPTDEVGATDVSGGELIVSTPDPNAVQVELPETPMTPVPNATASPTGTATASPTASPTPEATR